MGIPIGDQLQHGASGAGGQDIDWWQGIASNEVGVWPIRVQGAVKQLNIREVGMGKKPQVWRSEADGKLFHEDCFAEGESRDGFNPVKLDELEVDDECESCGGVFLIGLSPEDEDGDEPDDE